VRVKSSGKKKEWKKKGGEKGGEVGYRADERVVDVMKRTGEGGSRERIRGKRGKPNQISLVKKRIWRISHKFTQVIEKKSRNSVGGREK